jgi:cytochrome c556
MNKPSKNTSLLALLVVISLSLFGWALSTDEISARANAAKPAGASPHPVDDDMHHFMEYVFEPNYKRLKAGMAETTKDKKTWKAIKGDSLTLAECANLLLMRVPDENVGEWRKRSVAVRAHGGELYQAAKKSDDAAARKAYFAMLNNCNACHKQFADGKHQLQP